MVINSKLQTVNSPNVHGEFDRSLECDGTVVIGLDVVPPDEAVIDRVLRRLREHGYHMLACQLKYKNGLIEDDPDEIPVSLHSLEVFGRFVQIVGVVGSPELTVDPNGYVGLDWIIPDLRGLEFNGLVKFVGEDDHGWGNGDGVLVMWFLSDDLVRIYGTSGPLRQDMRRVRVDATVGFNDVNSVASPFIDRLRNL